MWVGLGFKKYAVVHPIQCPTATQGRGCSCCTGVKGRNAKCISWVKFILLEVKIVASSLGRICWNGESCSECACTLLSSVDV